MKNVWKTTAIALAALLVTAGIAETPQNKCKTGYTSIAAAAEENVSEYTVNIKLMQFHSDEISMGNASMIPKAHIVVTPDGTAELQIDMVSLTYLNKEGYLGWMKKVTEIISENKYHYPTEIKTEDVTVSEEYVDVFDAFNDPDSEYADAQVTGKWYPKKLSIPIDFEHQEDDILVQVYVPVMESIMEGSSTKFAVLDIDWDTLSEVREVAGDVNDDGELNVIDVIILQKWLLSVPDTELKNWKAADLCEDNKIDVFDLCLMKRELLNQMNITESN